MQIERRGETFTVIHRPRYWEKKYPIREPETFEIIERYSDPEGTMLEVGAWIGPMTLFGSRKFGRVYAMEPDSLARRYLIDHLEANNCDNVTVDGRAGWTETCTLPMNSRRGHLGSGESNVWGLHQPTGETVEAVDLVDVIERLVNVRFIKMDVEGAEHILIPHIEPICRERGIVLCVEMHEPKELPTTTRREVMFA